MNFKLLLALLPVFISASRFQSAPCPEEMISVESTEASQSVAENDVVVEQQEESETEAQAWFKRVMAYKEDPQKAAEHRRLAAEEMAPSPHIAEVIQRFKNVNLRHDQREDFRAHLRLRLHEAMQETEEDSGSPCADFDITLGIAGEMLPVYSRYQQLQQERK